MMPDLLAAILTLGGAVLVLLLAIVAVVLVIFIGICIIGVFLTIRDARRNRKGKAS